MANTKKKKARKSTAPRTPKRKQINLLPDAKRKPRKGHVLLHALAVVSPSGTFHAEFVTPDMLEDPAALFEQLRQQLTDPYEAADAEIHHAVIDLKIPASRVAKKAKVRTKKAQGRQAPAATSPAPAEPVEFEPEDGEPEHVDEGVEFDEEDEG